MATIRLNRTSEYMNKMRNYIIYIDGVKVGSIADGDIKDFEVTPGEHTIYAKVDWCYSPTMTIVAEESRVKCLKMGAFKNANWLIPLFLGIVVLHLILKITLHFEYTEYLGIPVFLIMVYYMSFGRKKYLTLTEDTI